MEIHVLACPRCTAPLKIRHEQGIVQCDHCGSTLYVDAHNQLQLNSNKIADNLHNLFDQLKRDAVANHRAIVHGSFDSEAIAVHFKDEPPKSDDKESNSEDVVFAVASVSFLIVFCILFSSLFDSLLTGIFVGFLASALALAALIGLLNSTKDSDHRKWRKDRELYIKNTSLEFEKSKFVALITEETLSFCNALIEQSREYNVKSTKLDVHLYAKGYRYSGTVNCPYRERLNDKMRDDWKKIYNKDIPFAENDFVFLNIEQREILLRILVNRLTENLRGKGAHIQTSGDHIEVQFDNGEYREPSLHKIW